MNKQTAQLLEQHFDTAFATPDGIKKLRELILTLAMQGKLVPQDTNDQPASELLREIEAEKQRLVKKGKIKAPKSLPPIKPEEIPYALPGSEPWQAPSKFHRHPGRDCRGPEAMDDNDGFSHPCDLDSLSALSESGNPCRNDGIHSGHWVWVRLGEIGEINPRNFLEDDKDAGFVPMPLIYSEYGAQHSFEPRKWVDIKKGYTHFANEDVGLAKITPCFENAKSCVFRGLPNGTGAGTTELHIFRNTFGAICPEYLLAYLKNPRYISTGISKMTGSAGQKRVPTDFFANYPFPLPPLAEQHRIVAKIDQLMARCDELEKLRAEREQRRLSVHTAAINRLLSYNGETTPEASSNEAWQFITQHFAELYAVKPNVTELRKAILQLAVMGKLVPQDPNDPPASELLKEIEAEKQRLVKEGKIKLSKPLREIGNDEKEFELPSGWVWSRLQNVLDVRDGTHDSPKDAIGPHTYPLITSKNFVNGMIDFSAARRISAEDHFEIIKRSKVEKYDILFSMIGGNIGNQVIVEEEREFSIKNVALFKYYSRDLTNPYFIKRFMEHLAINLQTKAAGGAQPFVSLGFLRNLVIALPPLPEQHSIVAKIDQLMVLCDTLEQQIDATTGKQTELLNAVMIQI